METQPLSSERIKAALTTSHVGRPAFYWPTVDSTMERAHQLADQASQVADLDGALIIADEQTAGRGRFHRSWWAPARSCLLFSLILVPPLRPAQAHRLTVICSLAVCDAIKGMTGLQARVKWPNDVLVDGKKVCGILTEMDLWGAELRYAIVGVGLNVNVDFSRAPPLMAPATSLKSETGRQVSRLRLLDALLSSVETRYCALRDGRSYHAEWAARMATLGQEVRVSSGTDHFLGLATGVDKDGALLLRLADGSTQRVLAGDVTLRRGEQGA